MSCYECHKVQEIALNKNNPNTVGIAYIRVEEANVAIVGCDKHVKILIERLR